MSNKNKSGRAAFCEKTRRGGMTGYARDEKIVRAGRTKKLNAKQRRCRKPNRARTRGAKKSEPPPSPRYVPARCRPQQLAREQNKKKKTGSAHQNESGAPPDGSYCCERASAGRGRSKEEKGREEKKRIMISAEKRVVKRRSKKLLRSTAADETSRRRSRAVLRWCARRAPRGG